MAWYDTGTVSVTNGSTTVTGAGTNFIAGAQIGEAFYGPDDNLYEIESITSATVLVLADPYLGSTQSGQDYKIVPTQSLVADLAGQVTTLINDFQTVADEAGEGKFDDGSATTPGITFTQDQDTGFFRETANEIGISVGGSKIGEFSSTGLNGTVIGDTTPAAVSGTTGDFSGDLTVDTDTLFVDASTNRVGIGTSSPSQKLDISGGNIKLDDSQALRFGTSAVASITGVDGSSGYLAFATNGVNDRMRIDSSGDLLVGKTSIDSNVQGLALSGQFNLAAFTRDQNPPLLLNRLTSDGMIAEFRKDGTTVGSIGTAGGGLTFSNSSSEAMRIDSSGNLLVGKTSKFSINTTPGFEFRSAVDGGFMGVTVDDDACALMNRLSSNGDIMDFRKDGSTVGTISVTGTTTAYNTSSDERLKENIADAQDASDLIDGIQVRQFDWRADGEHQRYGMIAQELDTVAPEAVTKGETEDDMWAVDYSKLVPMLVKEIQDLRKRVAELEGAT